MLSKFLVVNHLDFICTFRKSCDYSEDIIRGFIDQAIAETNQALFILNSNKKIIFITYYLMQNSEKLFKISGFKIRPNKHKIIEIK